MKKLNILLLSALVSVMTIVSCSKDDKAVSETPILKIPIGKFVFTTWNETKDGVISEERSAFRPGCTERRSYNFKDEVEMEEFAGYDPENPCSFSLYGGTYTQVGNVLTIDDSYARTYTILAVTATQLKIRWAFPENPSHLLTYTLIKE